MKRFFSVILAAAVLIPMFSARVSARPQVSAVSAALMVAGSGELLYEKNAWEKRPMASTTKIMTALLTLEAGEPEREIKVTEDMVKVEGTSMGLLPGDTVTLRALAYGMLLQSGNDAANTAAIAIGGNVERFVDMMNSRAVEIGMKSTLFITPSGLDDDGHGSTAYDMALLGCEAVSNPEFLNICSQTSAALEYGNPPYRRVLSNHNRLLWSYEGAVGVKTGFTKKSGRCLVSAACRDGVTLVAVTLRDGDDWNDHRRLLDYGFSMVKNTPLDADISSLSLKVFGGVSDRAGLVISPAPYAVLRNSTGEIKREIYLRPFEFAPVEAGRVVGTAVYSLDGKVICSSPIVTSSATYLKIIRNEPEHVKKKDGFFTKLVRKIKGIFGYGK